MSHTFFAMIPPLSRGVLILALALGMTAALPSLSCARKAAAKPTRQEAAQPQEPTSIWQPLITRLAAEGQDKAALKRLFATLPEHITPAPMGRKMLELYRSKFMPAKPDMQQPRPKYYKGTVTQANAEKCRAFLQQHETAFAEAEETFGVPRHVAVSLLFVETRLGANVGRVSALYTLASMALSTTPDMLGQWLGKLPEDYQTNLPWMREIAPKRAEWAYKELRALTAHMMRDQIAPESIPGSIYGAIGMCQFMPSNIALYGADGNHDGHVDLYTPADAIASLSRYLKEHGWKPGITREEQHAVLKTYNKSDTYAATILALSDVVLGGPVPPDAE